MHRTLVPPHLMAVPERVKLITAISESFKLIGAIEMLEKWISLKDNLGQTGSEGGVIQLDDELPDLARITIELKTSREPPGNHYAITMGVYGVLVHTAFFKRWEDAIECADTVKLIIQTLLTK